MYSGIPHPSKKNSKYDSEATCNEASATLGVECLDSNTNNDCKDWLKLINTAKKMKHLSERINVDNVKDDNSSSFLLHEHLCSVLDLGLSTDLRLSCLSQASSFVLYCPSIVKCPLIGRVAAQLLGGATFNELFHPNMEILMILHGPYSGVNSTVENILFDGDTMQFLQDYEVVGHIIFTVLEKSPSFLIYDEERNQRFNGCGGVCFFLRTVIGAYARELHPAKKHQGIFTMENNASDSPHHCASIAKVQYDSQGDAVLKTTPKLVEILSASQLKTYRKIQVSKFGAGTPKVFNLYQTPSQGCILDLPCHEMSSSELLLQSVNDRKQHEHNDGHANVRNKNRLFPRDTKQVFETRSII